MSEGENISGVSEPESPDSGKRGGRGNNNRGRNKDVPSPVVGVDVSKRDGASVPTVEVENGTLKHLESVNENMQFKNNRKMNAVLEEANENQDSRRQGEADALELVRPELLKMFPNDCQHRVYHKNGTVSSVPISQEDIMEKFLAVRSDKVRKFLLKKEFKSVSRQVFSFFGSNAFARLLGLVADKNDDEKKKEEISRLKREEIARVKKILKENGLNEWSNKTDLQKAGDSSLEVIDDLNEIRFERAAQGKSIAPSVDSLGGDISSQEDTPNTVQDVDQKIPQVEQRVPNEDGVVEGVGLAEELKPEIVFDEDESNSVVAPDQVGAVVEESKPKIVFDKDVPSGEVVNDQDGDFEYQASLGDVPDMKMDLQGESKKEEFREKDIEQGGLGSAVYKEAIDYMAEEKFRKKPLDQRVPNEDGVVEGVGLVEEPKIEDIEENAKVKKELATFEGEFSRISVEEARQEMEKAGKVYADLRGREDKIRNRLPKFLLSLVGKGEKTDATKQERIWRGTVSEYQQLRLEEIKQAAKSEKWSSDRLKKEMAELVRETDIRARLAAISHYDNAKWGESGETWKTRLLGRSKKFAEGYRTFCKEHKVAAFALRGGLLLGSGALGGAALALPMGVLMRALGSYGAARALKEFFDRRANEKLVAEAEQSEALKSVEKMVVTPENLAKFQEQLRKTDVVEQFEGFRKGAKRRAKWALFLGGGLFLGGMALSHFAHAAQEVAEAKGAVSVSGVVDGASHDAVGSHAGIAELPLPTPSAVSEMPAGASGVAETILQDTATESATHASLEAAPLVVHSGSSIEGTIIEHLTGAGMSKEEAGKVAHRMVLLYAREHHIPFKELNLVQPDTNFSIIPNPDNVKTPFRIENIETIGSTHQNIPELTPIAPEVSDIATPESPIVSAPTPETSPLQSVGQDVGVVLPVAGAEGSFEVSEGMLKTGVKTGAGVVLGGGALFAGEKIADRLRKKTEQKKKTNGDVGEGHQEGIGKSSQEESVAEAEAFFKKILSIQSLHGRARESFKNIRDYFASSLTDEPFQHTFVRKELCQILLDEPENRLSEDFLREPFWKVMGPNKQEFLVLQALFEKTGEKFPWDVQYRSVDDVLNLFTERFVTGKLPQNDLNRDNKNSQSATV